MFAPHSIGTRLCVVRTTGFPPVRQSAREVHNSLFRKAAQTHTSQVGAEGSVKV